MAIGIANDAKAVSALERILHDPLECAPCGMHFYGFLEPAIVGHGDVGCCQTNANQSQIAAEDVNLCGTKLTPLGESGGPV
ncbi:hypothetical protein [Pseudopelagicola sp. nBUS_19]|uniref:hypothetical protein n=1 Tax=Pseudopelagicola sp. nBUS_19 TaxID=3395316 RepID=UPI003EBBFC54